jgi:hypothetical protein
MSVPTDDLAPLLARMDAQVGRLRDRRDVRRIFLAVYATMTGAIRRALAEGRFMDPRWTTELTTRFAGLYFDAEEAWQLGGRCPGPWEAAFAAGGHRRISTFEHALLGINAHIVYDLPFAVAATMREVGDVVEGRLDAATLVRRRHDYEVVNQVLAETITAAQAVLARESRMTAWLDVAAMRLDEYAAELLLRVSRTQGWHAALALAVARDDTECEAVRRHLDRVACSYVERIDLARMVPTAAGRRLMRRVRPPLAELIGTDTVLLRADGGLLRDEELDGRDGHLLGVDPTGDGDDRRAR